MKILVLNTGSTSTKLALYTDEKKTVQKEYMHSKEELSAYPFMADQLPMRKELARTFILEVQSHAPFDAFVARGGILPPVQSGGYIINQAMCDYLQYVCNQEHASNLAAFIAYDLLKEFHIPHGYIYDAITTDELTPVAHISGLPDLPRVARTHALNMRAVAHKAAEALGKTYQTSTIITAHLGGGFSMSIHKDGRVVDMISDDEGPFSPERAGRQQAVALTNYWGAQEGSVRDRIRILRGKSGLAAHLGTSDAREVEKMIADGNERAKLVYEAMAYQVAKGVGELSTVARGKVDSIVLTGGLAYSELFTGMIRDIISYIAPVQVFPGENEMESLALGALRILRGEETALEFTYQS